MLCKDIPAAVGACYGIPPVLMHGGGSETVTREAFRRMIVATIAPLAALASEALSVALSAPVALNLRALRAYDVQGNSRAYGALIKSGMAHAEAAELTGTGRMKLLRATVAPPDVPDAVRAHALALAREKAVMDNTVAGAGAAVRGERD